MKKFFLSLLAGLSLMLGFAFIANAMDSSTYSNSDTSKSGPVDNGFTKH